MLKKEAKEISSVSPAPVPVIDVGDDDGAWLPPVIKSRMPPAKVQAELDSGADIDHTPIANASWRGTVPKPALEVDVEMEAEAVDIAGPHGYWHRLGGMIGGFRWVGQLRYRITSMARIPPCDTMVRDLTEHWSEDGLLPTGLIRSGVGGRLPQVVAEVGAHSFSKPPVWDCIVWRSAGIGGCVWLATTSGDRTRRKSRPVVGARSCSISLGVRSNVGLMSTSINTPT